MTTFSSVSEHSAAIFTLVQCQPVRNEAKKDEGQGAIPEQQIQV